MRKNKLDSLKRGHVVKVWRGYYGGQGHDYVVVGKFAIANKLDPHVVLIKKNSIKKDGSLNVRAKYFAVKASSIKVVVGYIDIERFLSTWGTGFLAQHTTPSTNVSVKSLAS